MRTWRRDRGCTKAIDNERFPAATFVCEYLDEEGYLRPGCPLMPLVSHRSLIPKFRAIDKILNNVRDKYGAWTKRYVWEAIIAFTRMTRKPTIIHYTTLSHYLSNVESMKNLLIIVSNTIL